MKKITLVMQADDAEPILRDAAAQAAKYGAWCDYIWSNTYNRPGSYSQPLADVKKEWKASFLRAKRIVESFGVEYEQTSEPETLTVHIPMKNQKEKPRNVAGLRFIEVSGGELDPKNAMPEYRRGTHEEACRYAAKRVVARWRSMIEQAKAA